MKIDPDRYRIRKDESVHLGDRPTRVDPLYSSKAEYETVLRAKVERLAQLQEMLYAGDSRALLVVMQGMDTSGKDSVIRHVMSGINPQGCEVHNFKQPSVEELHHDYLWRASRVMPARGHIGVFNRSYYEELIVVRVHPEFLVGQGLDAGVADDKDFWKGRYRAINEMERHLRACNTHVVKILLHLSKEEQRQRLIARIDEPDKNWKVNANDIAERARWADYVDAYERCLSATSTKGAPWFVVPADDKPNAHLIVAEIMLAALADMDLRMPEVGDERGTELTALRERLAGEGERPRKRSKQ